MEEQNTCSPRPSSSNIKLEHVSHQEKLLLLQQVESVLFFHKMVLEMQNSQIWNSWNSQIWTDSKYRILRSEPLGQEHTSLNVTESAMKLLTNMEVVDARTKDKQVVGLQVWNVISWDVKVFGHWK